MASTIDTLLEALAGAVQQKAKPIVVDSVDIDRSSDRLKITIPEGLSYGDAAQYLIAKQEEMDATTKVSRNFGVLPWSGAYAVNKVTARYSTNKLDDGSYIEVPAAGGTKTIFWGGYRWPGLGKLYMSAEMGALGFEFEVFIRCQRSLEAVAEKVLNEIAEEVEKGELYRGAVLHLNPERDVHGNLQPMTITTPPKVMPVPKSTASDMVLNSDLEAALRAQVFLPIEQPELLRKRGISVSRGALFAGRPGTGKTMASAVATKLASDRGWATFYVSDASALEVSLRVAQQFQPALVICEDVDRELGGQRTTTVDRILNVLDGLDKDQQVMVLLTTNDDRNLPSPLLRAGRMHSVIAFEEPDADAAERLLRKHLPNPPKTMKAASEICAGLIPASIEEVAKRAQLHALSSGRTDPNEEDLKNASLSVRKQEDRLKEAERRETAEKLPEMILRHQDHKPNGAVTAVDPKKVPAVHAAYEAANA